MYLWWHSTLHPGGEPEHRQGLTLSLLLIIWGAAWAAAYYIPPSILAMRIGGSQHAALVTNIFDMGGHVFGSLFNYSASKSGGRGDWSTVMVTLVVCNAVGLCSMALAMSPEKSWTAPFTPNADERMRVSRVVKPLK